MNIKDLEYFNTLGELLSFTQVANHFHVSQPTISYAVKRLEEFFNCDLIAKDAGRRSVLLTVEGVILKNHIEVILYELKTAERAIQHSKNKKMHIGLPPIIRAQLFSELASQREDLAFIAQFALESAGSPELLAKLLNGRLDFSLIGSIAPLVHPNLIVKQLSQHEFYIYVSTDNPLAVKSEISFEEALDYPFILLDERFTHMRAFESLSKNYHKDPQIRFRFTDLQTIGQLVKADIGITLMTDFESFQEKDGLVKIPLREKEKIYFYVQYAYLKNNVMTEKLLKLMTILDGLYEDQLKMK